MVLLRLTQHAETQLDHYLVEVALEGDGPRQTTTARFEFKLTSQDHEDLRWYLEDFLQYPLDPAPKIASRIEQRMVKIGAGLFEAVFGASDDARDLWVILRDKLDDTRVEIITDVRQAATVPWELIRDLKTDTPLALRAQAFVRAQPNPVQRPSLPKQGDRFRILLNQTTADWDTLALTAHRDAQLGALRWQVPPCLGFRFHKCDCTNLVCFDLVICRPGGRVDVPFRSVASRLIRGLDEHAREAFQLDVLRPPTFKQLGKALREAKARGQPYHVVHFDGHGIYAELEQLSMAADWLKQLSPLVLAGPRVGSHGYLMFENPKLPDQIELVDGPSLGKLLVETDVPVLVLNACRSAHADVTTAPAALAEVSESGEAMDPHVQVRAFGSLAQEVMDAGVVGVVAMRYNVYVATAAQFVADLYAALAQGLSLGEAVTLGRKQLAAQPLREIAYRPIPLQDWPVPVIYEAAPVTLFPKAGAGPPGVPLRISLTSEVQAPTPNAQLPTPDVGFFGRDETLLALDRAFDTQRVVLLHAYAGSGKTTTAAEFARWYALTGGLKGPVLFTSFEQYKPLAHVLDTLGQVFEEVLGQNNIHWLALGDDERRRVSLQLLRVIPVLWIWDSVEPVAGFPMGTPSAWSREEQTEMKDFLLVARETEAKFLLTSRRDERSWLGDLPMRLTLPPMPMQECVQLVRALTEKHGRQLTDVDDWLPLLQFSQGNPLTITVLVGQALRDELKTHEQIEAFVSKLRAGEAAFDDETSEGRSKSLSASLSYGFEHAFTKDEHKILALLHFFQGVVTVGALYNMGHLTTAWNLTTFWGLPEVRDLTYEQGVSLLERAAEIGLLTSHGGSYYSVHPALSWYFRNLFEVHYPKATDPKSKVTNQQLAAQAFIRAMSVFGHSSGQKYEEGDNSAIHQLTIHEANLLYARELARKGSQWDAVISVMQGLRQLYHHMGRLTEWARLVNEIVPDFIDLTTNGPLADREDQWSDIIGYRVRLALEARNLRDAEHLQNTLVEWLRPRAASAFVASTFLDTERRNTFAVVVQGSSSRWSTTGSIIDNSIRSFAVALVDLGDILREQGNSACVAVYEEASQLSHHINDDSLEAVAAFDLGLSFTQLKAVRDLTQAECWYWRSMELTDVHDELGKGQCWSQLGTLAYMRFKEALVSKHPVEDTCDHLNTAADYCQKALELTPSNATHALAVIHCQLGEICGSSNLFDHAVSHFQESIRYFQAGGAFYNVAKVRLEMACTMYVYDRLTDAYYYAEAAQRDLEAFGERAEKDDIKSTENLIELIRQRKKIEGYV